jgi:hypothetical protein
MKPFLRIASGALLLAGAGLWLSAVRGEQPERMNVAAPEFSDADEWINTRPLALKDVRGKVVVLHFWTFG